MNWINQIISFRMTDSITKNTQQQTTMINKKSLSLTHQTCWDTGDTTGHWYRDVLADGSTVVSWWGPGSHTPYTGRQSSRVPSPSDALAGPWCWHGNCSGHRQRACHLWSDRICLWWNFYFMISSFLLTNCDMLKVSYRKMLLGSLICST